MKRSFLSECNSDPQKRSRIAEYVAMKGNGELSVKQCVGGYYSVVTSGDNQYLLAFLQEQIDPGFYYPEILMRCVRLLPESDIYIKSLLAMRHRFPEHRKRLREVILGENIDPIIKANITEFIEREALPPAMPIRTASPQTIAATVQDPVPGVKVLAVPAVFPVGDATIVRIPSFGFEVEVRHVPSPQNQQMVSDFDAGYVPGEGIKAAMVSHVSVDDNTGDGQTSDGHADDCHTQHLAALQAATAAAKVSCVYQVAERADESADEWSGTETDEEEMYRDWREQIMYD